MKWCDQIFLDFRQSRDVQSRVSGQPSDFESAVLHKPCFQVMLFADAACLQEPSDVGNWNLVGDPAIYEKGFMAKTDIPYISH